MYKFQSFYIPERMMSSLKRYIEEGKKPGSFLTAVIENDFSAACGFADNENIRNLPAYATYFYNEAPSPCWGSKKKMKAWMAYKQKGKEMQKDEIDAYANNQVAERFD